MLGSDCLAPGLFICGVPPKAVGDSANVFATLADAMEAVERSSQEVVVLCDATLVERARHLASITNDCEDLAHAGLLSGGAGAFGIAKLACLNWFLLDPAARRICKSWRATPSLCLLRPQVVRDLGGFDAAYANPASRLMDFGFRVLLAGGSTTHYPVLSKVEKPARPLSIPLDDEYVFMLRHIGVWHARWAAFWSPLTGKNPLTSWAALRRATRKVKQIPAPTRRPIGLPSRLLGAEKRQEVRSITAIIPTLNRYEYVPRSIQSLLSQNRPPDEIIVVDQSSRERRRPEVYAPFQGDGFRVIYQDSPGQSTSRNEAIRQASGEWCLLWEDDTEAWDGLIEEHVRAVEYSGADASTGVSLAPWKTVDYIPAEKRHYQLADVLATGNCLVRREALMEVGGLDVAFNRGSGADHDLGARLYLSGKTIIFNPRAIETHHKASTGGMRTYGAWWRNRSTWFAPFPPPTQVYTVRRYYPRSYRLPLYLLYYWTATKQHRLLEYLWLWVAAPWKLFTAMRLASKLKTQFAFHTDAQATN